MQVIKVMREAVKAGSLVRVTLAPEGEPSIRVSVREIPGNAAVDLAGMLVGSFDRPARDTSGGAGIPDFQENDGNTTTWDDFASWMRNGLLALGYNVEWLEYDVSDEAVTTGGVEFGENGDGATYAERVTVKIVG